MSEKRCAGNPSSLARFSNFLAGVHKYLRLVHKLGRGHRGYAAFVVYSFVRASMWANDPLVMLSIGAGTSIRLDDRMRCCRFSGRSLRSNSTGLRYPIVE